MRAAGWACLLVGAGGLTPEQADRYLGQLTSADPRQRTAATAALAQSAVSRPAVIRALATAPPEAAGRLRTVLLQTGPWELDELFARGDRLRPPLPRIRLRRNPIQPESQEMAVRLAFAGYASLPTEERCERVERLPGTLAAAQLIKVLTADPSPAVRWSAANSLRMAFDPVRPAVGDDDAPPVAPAVPAANPPKPIAQQVLELVDVPADASTYPVPAANGPLLAAAAWALRGTDPARADGLMARALAIEVEAPSSFRGQSDFAFLWAGDRAVDRGDWATAAGCYRELAARTAFSVVEVPQPLADLFAVHAEHGPLAGFVDDVRQAQPYLDRPEVIYCLAAVAGRTGGWITGPVAEAAGQVAALAAGGASVESHCATGLYLLRHGWADAAERELRASLLLSGGQSVNVYLALYAAAADRDDDAAAGRYLDGALRRAGPGGWERINRYGGANRPWTDLSARAQAHWHHLRAAVTAGDRETALARADQILTLDADAKVLADDPGMAADLVPVLLDAGRRTQADAVFDAAAKLLDEQVRKSPADPMPKNNLAWLLARSDRRLADADQLSAKAVELDPADAACLDTRAEVLARLNRPADAAAMEERALAVKPHDLYMRRQLERFRAAAATGR